MIIPVDHRFPSLLLSVVLAIGAISIASAADDSVDFVLDVKPFVESHCVGCHKEGHAKGELRLDTKAGAFKGGGKGAAIVLGDPNKSLLYTSTILSVDHDDLMPPRGKGGPLDKSQTDMLRAWILAGASWPEGVELKQTTRVDFVKDIQPIFEFNCLGCHREGNTKGGFRLDNKIDAMKGGENGVAIVPRRADKGLLIASVTAAPDDEKLMPPKKKDGPLPKEAQQLLASWVSQGAVWPDGVKLVPRKREDAKGDELAGVVAIHQKLVANLKEKSGAEMRSYTNTISGTRVTFAMLAIPGGELTLGSPESENGRNADEGPQGKIQLSPFWMGRCEVTWDEYELFMYPEFEKSNTIDTNNPYLDKVSDAVSRPTRPYVEMSFGMGKNGFPAISMTQHAANKYCQWLSAKTGQFYRLPTEAEWEYACRAGTSTRYSFGDDPASLSDYAWFAKNSDFKYQKVGRKKPNPWGLYDMHGNVGEWCLDQYDKSGYGRLLTSPIDPWNRSVTPYPHVVRGGGWDDEDPALLRSAARKASNKTWKIQDPQLPKSIWYLTDAQFLGFRLVRPLRVPPPEELVKIWNNGVERD